MNGGVTEGDGTAKGESDSIIVDINGLFVCVDRDVLEGGSDSIIVDPDGCLVTRGVVVVDDSPPDVGIALGHEVGSMIVDPDGCFDDAVGMRLAGIWGRGVSLSKGGGAGNLVLAVVV